MPAHERISTWRMRRHQNQYTAFFFECVSLLRCKLRACHHFYKLLLNGTNENFERMRCNVVPAGERFRFVDDVQVISKQK